MDAQVFILFYYYLYLIFSQYCHGFLQSRKTWKHQGLKTLIKLFKKNNNNLEIDIYNFIFFLITHSSHNINFKLKCSIYEIILLVNIFFKAAFIWSKYSKYVKIVKYYYNLK